MHLLRRIATIIGIVTTYPLYFLSLLIPRDKRLWVFVGWHRGRDMEIFADNTKYLFLYVHKYCPDIRPVWLSKDSELASLLRARGYEAYADASPKGIFYALRAGITFTDAYLLRNNFIFSGTSTLVQLLHGKGMKKGGYNKPQFRSYDYIFGPSEFALNLLPTSFTHGSRTHASGYPRDDLFFSHIEGSDISTDEQARKELKDARARNARCILYAPTYRRGQSTLNIMDILDLPKTETWLEEKNYTLFISLHPKYRGQSRSNSTERLKFVEDSDIYPLMPEFDLLVTDYSSIFTDFLLLNKPMVFYPYDIEEYASAEGFNVDYETHTPGEKARSAQELRGAIERALTHDTGSDERLRVRSLYHAHADGKASERIVNTLRADNAIEPPSG